MHHLPSSIFLIDNFKLDLYFVYQYPYPCHPERSEGSSLFRQLADEIIRFVQNDKKKFEHRETSGSHLVMKHADGRMTIVARHQGKNIPRGTLNGILQRYQCFF